METDEFNALVAANFQKRYELMQKKGKDYANSDRLSNFKIMGKMIRESQLDVVFNRDPKLGYALLLIIMKFNRIVNILASGSLPENEALADSIADMQNYIDLFNGLVNENDSEVGKG